MNQHNLGSAARLIPSKKLQLLNQIVEQIERAYKKKIGKKDTAIDRAPQV